MLDLVPTVIVPATLESELSSQGSHPVPLRSQTGWRSHHTTCSTKIGACGSCSRICVTHGVPSSWSRTVLHVVPAPATLRSTLDAVLVGTTCSAYSRPVGAGVVRGACPAAPRVSASCAQFSEWLEWVLHAVPVWVNPGPALRARQQGPVFDIPALNHSHPGWSRTFQVGLCAGLVSQYHS